MPDEPAVTPPAATPAPATPPEAPPAPPAAAPAPPAAAPAAPAAPEGPAPTDYFGRALAAMASQDGAGEPPPAPAPAAVDPDQGDPPPAGAGGEPEPTPAEPQAQPTAAPDHAMLAAQRASLDQDRLAFNNQQQQAAPQLAALERVKTASGVDAIMALRELGLDYSELTKRVLENPASGQPAPAAGEPNPLNTRMDAIEESMASNRREAITAQAAHAIRNQVETSKDPMRWDLLKRQPNFGRQVVEYCERHWAANGSPRDAHGNPTMSLTAAEAADNIETYLMGDHTRYSDSPKIRALYTTPGEPPPEPHQATPPLAPAATPGAPPTQATVPAPATLTTSHASTAARSSDTADPAACRARAIAVLEQS